MIERILNTELQMNLQKARLSGRVIMPQDAGFDKARALSYGWIDRRPAVIVRAVNKTDVSRVISQVVLKKSFF